MNLQQFTGRFSGYFGWPLSRKVVLLGVVGMIGSLTAGGVNFVTHSVTRSPVMDLAQLDAFIGAWLVAQLLATLANVPAARAGREARALAYLFIGVQSVFMAGLLHLFGTMASPLVAIFPAMVILWTLTLDEYVGCSASR